MSSTCRLRSMAVVELSGRVPHPCRACRHDESRTGRRRTRGLLRFSLRRSATSPRETARRSGAPTRSSETAQSPFDTRPRPCASSTRACAGFLPARDAHRRFRGRVRSREAPTPCACSEGSRGRLASNYSRAILELAPWPSAPRRSRDRARAPARSTKSPIARPRGCPRFQWYRALQVRLVRFGAARRRAAEHVDLIGHELHRERARDVRRRRRSARFSVSPSDRS